MYTYPHIRIHILHPLSYSYMYTYSHILIFIYVYTSTYTHSYMYTYPHILMHILHPLSYSNTPTQIPATRRPSSKSRFCYHRRTLHIRQEGFLLLLLNWRQNSISTSRAASASASSLAAAAAAVQLRKQYGGDQVFAARRAAQQFRISQK